MTGNNSTVLLKCSGEALADQSGNGYDANALSSLAKRLIDLHQSGTKVGVVLGGGNLFRGIAGGNELGIERTTADTAGMLATMMNGLLVAQAVRHLGCKAVLFSSIPCPSVADLYRQDKAMEALEDSIVFFVGGTGHPYFTTDSAAALRACEIGADCLIKLTGVDGVYSDDPRVDEAATFYETISYQDFISKRLGVMDLTAVTLCMNGNIKIRVCNFNGGSFSDALTGNFGSVIEEDI